MPAAASWQPATLVLKFEGKVLAWRDACPHMGVSLVWRPERLLSEDGKHLVCANHGAAFRLPDGICVYGPCRKETLTPVTIEVRDDAVWAL